MYYNELINNLKSEQEFLDNLMRNNNLNLNLNEFDNYLLKNYYVNNGLLIFALNNLHKYYILETNGLSELIKTELRSEVLDELIKLSGTLADIEMSLRKYKELNKLNNDLLLYLKENNYDNYLDNLNNFVEFEILNLVN